MAVCSETSLISLLKLGYQRGDTDHTAIGDHADHDSTPYTFLGLRAELKDMSAIRTELDNG